MKLGSISEVPLKERTVWNSLGTESLAHCICEAGESIGDIRIPHEDRLPHEMPWVSSTSLPMETSVGAKC